ncbi:hypothetical protein SARC_05192 [Sphaeroforma arctica JP610]|uniref:K Homology domain-containing protein n=1 Tax=Sphaeroforma arctica JP610 TaxID=667725 RepID=A0A0L0G109_9EUKA|nr:hypothetical protein SARC_05192 [Sphaeroforma arctica JP610]KNC82519.1 hypothetical protein SARC_05192 [Sphaeroforma arctica JP610]|eukprot:XP_014156421.1 hypothetical protein SARC_05192 [Sphaeroforma arctica JP610]
MDFQDMLQQAKDRASAIAKGEPAPAATAAPAAAAYTATGEADANAASAGTKRPHDDGGDDDGAAKRVNTGLGYDQSSIMPTSDVYDIPTSAAGLVIGRGGETIKRLQAESGARLQIAPDSHDGVHRRVTITGDGASIAKVRSLIKEVVDTSQSSSSTGGNAEPEERVEVMCPNNRVGVIIGRGGEKIRELQAHSGARIQVIQDNQPPGAIEKPVVISGDREKVAIAKKMVEEIIADSPYDNSTVGGSARGGSFGGMGSGGNSGFGGQSGSYQESPYGTVKVEIRIPSDGVGLVIGHGGSTIKRLQAESGAKIQLEQDMGRPERVVTIEGFAESVKRGEAAVMEIVNQHKERQGRGSMGGGTGGHGGMGGSDGRPDVRIPVDSTKVGLVIGRGGETIKMIIAETGARVQLDRDGPQYGPEKFFLVNGTDEEIAAARAMIMEKAGGGPMGGGGGYNSRGPAPGDPNSWGQGAPGGQSGGYGSRGGSQGAGGYGPRGGQAGPGGYGPPGGQSSGGYGSQGGGYGSQSAQGGGYGSRPSQGGQSGGYGQDRRDSSYSQGAPGGSSTGPSGGGFSAPGGDSQGGYGAPGAQQGAQGGYGAGSQGGYGSSSQGNQSSAQGGYGSQGAAAGGYGQSQGQGAGGYNSQAPAAGGYGASQQSGYTASSQQSSSEPAPPGQEMYNQQQGQQGASAGQSSEQWTEQQKIWAEQWKEYYAQQAKAGGEGAAQQ